MMSDVNWIITDAQACSAIAANIGTGKIIIRPNGNLSLINNANVPENQRFSAPKGA